MCMENCGYWVLCFDFWYYNYGYGEGRNDEERKMRMRMMSRPWGKSAECYVALELLSLVSSALPGGIYSCLIGVFEMRVCLEGVENVGVTWALC